MDSGNTKIREWVMRIAARGGARLGMALFALVGVVAMLAIPASRSADDEILLYPLPEASYAEVLHVTGLASPWKSIRIEADGVVVGRARANESGDFAAAVRLQAGAHNVRAVEDGARFHPLASPTYSVRQLAVPEASAQSGSKPSAGVQSKAGAPRNFTIKGAAAPTLNVPPATTSSNPITLSGTAPAASTVAFYVNGRFTREITAAANGTFSTWVPLEDSLNSIYAVATDATGPSPASNTVQTTYTNSLPRTYAATTISVPTVWTAGSAPTYTLNGQLTIASGATLWVQPGVTVSVAGNYKVLANGSLVVRGTTSSRVVFRPVQALCTDTSVRRTDWQGIEAATSTGSGSIEYAAIYCATNAVYFNLGGGNVIASRILNGGAGIRAIGSSSVVTTPHISGANEIAGNDYGVFADANSRPEVYGENVIYGNSYGVYVRGNDNAAQNPLPILNGNSLYGNSTANYYVRSFGNPSAIVLNAQGNWWGTAALDTVAATINDRKYSSTAPFVDFSGYLSSANGPPATSENTLIGPITATSTLTSGTYQMLGDVVVNSGVVWTLSPGVTIRSVSGRKIQVAASGQLQAIGSPTQRVHFTSGTAYTAKGDWAGIEVLAGGSATLDRVRVEYAVSGVDFNGGQGAVSRSLLRFNTNGIYVRAKSNPTINQGNQISHNDYGIVVRGASVAADNPLPVANGNSLFANADYNYYTTAFSTPMPTLNATGNWWGVVTQAGVVATIFTGHPSSAPVDSSGFLATEPVPQAILLTGLSMSDQQVRPLITQQMAQGVFALNRSGSVTYRVVRDADDAVVREWTQSIPASGQYGFSWNGFDHAGAAVPGGLYRIVIVATDGLDPYVFDVAMPGKYNLPFIALSANYDPYRNESYKVALTTTESSLLSLVVTPTMGTPFFVFENLHYPTGTHWVYWDGRGPDGTLLTSSSSVFATDPQRMRANGVFAYTPAITVTGTGLAPSVEVKSDPYLVTHSFDQASNIVYRIDADALVRVTVLPPGIVDPSHASAIVLLNNVTQQARDTNGNPIDHTVVWRGFADTDPNGVLVANDGAYTFAIEATLQATGRKTVYRGILNMVQ